MQTEGPYAQIYSASRVLWVNKKQQLPYCHHEKAEFRHEQGRQAGVGEEELCLLPKTHNKKNKTNNVHSNSACIVYLYDNVNLQIYCVIKESCIWHRNECNETKTHLRRFRDYVSHPPISNVRETCPTPQPRWINTTTLHLHIPNSKCNPKHHTQ